MTRKLTYEELEQRVKVLEKEVVRLKSNEEARPRTYKVTCKDGTRKVINFRPVNMESGDQFVIYEDITERAGMQAGPQRT